MKPPSLRIDRLLWFLRLSPSRSAAQIRIEAGHMRVNGQRINKTAHPIHIGDVLTLPIGEQVRVIEISALPSRRGPAPEAVGHYRDRVLHTYESDSQHGEVIDGGACADLGTGTKD